MEAICHQPERSAVTRQWAAMADELEGTTACRRAAAEVNQHLYRLIETWPPKISPERCVNCVSPRSVSSL